MKMGMISISSAEEIVGPGGSEGILMEGVAHGDTALQALQALAEKTDSQVVLANDFPRRARAKFLSMTELGDQYKRIFGHENFTGNALQN